jgi:hypothetical protein
MTFSPLQINLANQVKKLAEFGSNQEKFSNKFQ